MLIKIKDKATLILLSFLGVILIYTIFRIFYDYDTKMNCKYSIAILKKVETVGRSATNRIIFNYDFETKEVIGSDSFRNDSTEYYKTQIGNRFLVKMNNKQWVNRYFFTYKLYINKPVPDSVEMPVDGWKELPDWAK